MGARYAAANDLSMVIGTQLRQPQFLPFIRYQLEYPVASQNVGQQVLLEVKDLDPRPGAILQQNRATLLPSQDFSFEDAGDGFVYIRSHVSNLYVTAQTTGGVLTGGEPSTGGAVGGSPPAADAPGLIQDFKYHHFFQRSQLQKWTFSRVAASFASDRYVISNQAHPDMVLQPADSSQLNSPVILGAASSSPHTHIPANSWKVSITPLLL
jgi:hypothetical protein